LFGFLSKASNLIQFEIGYNTSMHFKNNGPLNCGRKTEVASTEHTSTSIITKPMAWKNGAIESVLFFRLYVACM
jgi:hypothetical protein